MKQSNKNAWSGSESRHGIWAAGGAIGQSQINTRESFDIHNIDRQRKFSHGASPLLANHSVAKLM
jgi:hypothetical protein